MDEIIGKSDQENRRSIESGKIKTILSIENGNRKDSLRQLDSGLNHVLARIASKNKTRIGIDLSEIRKLDKKEKAIRLSRIIQNIRVCRKNNTKMTIKGDKGNSLYLLLSLGSSTSQAREATQSF